MKLDELVGADLSCPPPIYRPSVDFLLIYFIEFCTSIPRGQCPLWFHPEEEPGDIRPLHQEVVSQHRCRYSQAEDGQVL